MHFEKTEIGNPPSNDEVEISVLGPGYGEAIVVHVGDGKWIVTDSCIFPNETIAAPIQYLDALGVAPEQVEILVCSHWDDDHIRGFSQLVKSYANADVVVGSTFREKDFLTYASLFSRPQTQKVRGGVEEVAKTLHLSGARSH